MMFAKNPFPAALLTRRALSAQDRKGNVLSTFVAMPSEWRPMSTPLSMRSPKNVGQ
jgi:hypothetical protein